MKCANCDMELGQGDLYDLMTGHIFSCKSKVGKIYARSLENVYNGLDSDY